MLMPAVAPETDDCSGNKASAGGSGTPDTAGVNTAGRDRRPNCILSDSRVLSEGRQELAGGKLEVYLLAPLAEANTEM